MFGLCQPANNETRCVGGGGSAHHKNPLYTMLALLTRTREIQKGGSVFLLPLLFTRRSDGGGSCKPADCLVGPPPRLPHLVYSIHCLLSLVVDDKYYLGRWRRSRRQPHHNTK